MKGEWVEQSEAGSDAPAEQVIAELERSWSDSRASTRVVIGIEDVAFHQEVQDFIGRDPRFEIVAATVSGERLTQLATDRSFDVLVACPSVAAVFRDMTSHRFAEPLVMVAEELTVPVLRTAIDAGATAIFNWPGEREAFIGALATVRARTHESEAGRGMVIAVHGSRGGAGATFVATNLAASLADQGLRTTLVDLDVSFSDVTAALGIDAQDAPRTVADLVPVMAELSPDHLDDAAFRHERGFSVLLAPPQAGDPETIQPGLYRASIALLAGVNDVVVLHLPRAVDRVARSGFALSDQALLVTTLDLFSLYGAKRVMALLGREVPAGRWRLVVNKPVKSALTEADIERVLGLRPQTTIRFDPRVRRAQERGELLPPKAGGIGRDIRRLASLLDVERVEARSEGKGRRA